MKARFTEQQPPVKIVESEDAAYVFICLNEEEKTEEYPDMGEGQTTEAYYEYDYNEIAGPTNNLPLDDIQANPENYLDYAYTPEEKEDSVAKALAKIQELEAAIKRGLTI